MTDTTTSNNWLSRPLSKIYTDNGRKTFLIAIVSISIITPLLTVEYLEPIQVWFPIVAVTGIILIRKGWPQSIPTWLLYNLFSMYFMMYAIYSFGIMLDIEIMVLFILGMTIYDIIGVKGGQMQSMAGKMINWGVPIFIMVPHTKNFEFSKFTQIIREEGLEGLHGSDQGVSMLGIGDGFLPGALAISAASVGSITLLGSLQLTLPQLGAAIGGIIGLSALMWAELPKAIAALIVSAPGALIGFGIGIGLDILFVSI